MRRLAKLWQLWQSVLCGSRCDPEKADEGGSGGSGSGCGEAVAAVVAAKDILAVGPATLFIQYVSADIAAWEDAVVMEVRKL